MKLSTWLQRHVVLDDPVAAGDARVERAVGDIARHLLRAQDTAAQRRVVGGRDVRARADGDAPAGFAHQLERLILEAALRNAEFQKLVSHVAINRPTFSLMAVVGAVLGGIDFALIDDFPRAVIELAEEARLVALVACGAVAALLDGDHDRVGVAVDANLVHDLKISRLLALAPQLFARAREVACAASRDRLVEGFAIHIGDGQHAMAQMIDRDRGDDAAVFVEINRCRC